MLAPYTVAAVAAVSIETEATVAHFVAFALIGICCRSCCAAAVELLLLLLLLLLLSSSSPVFLLLHIKFCRFFKQLLKTWCFGT